MFPRSFLSLLSRTETGGFLSSTEPVQNNFGVQNNESVLTNTSQGKQTSSPAVVADPSDDLKVTLRVPANLFSIKQCGNSVFNKDANEGRFPSQYSQETFESSEPTDLGEHELAFSEPSYEPDRQVCTRCIGKRGVSEANRFCDVGIKGVLRSFNRFFRAELEKFKS